MTHENLLERWKTKIKDYLFLKGIRDREKLSAYEFLTDQIVAIRFEDGSYVQFKYPLLIEAPELKEAGMFTAHCGYPIFKRPGTQINLELAREWHANIILRHSFGVDPSIAF